MKIARRVVFTALILGLLACLGAYAWLFSSSPSYSGTVALSGLTEKVEVYFDDFGVPHIQANSKEDAYFALGYVHAQDRLFQMEMIRRLATGRLSEVLGKDLVQIDRFFRSLRIAETSKQDAAALFATDTAEYQRLTKAYVAGINQFIETGPTPPEFAILGIPKTPFLLEDCLNALGYMSFSFAAAIQTDPWYDQVYRKLGPEYAAVLGAFHRSGEATIPVFPDTAQLANLPSALARQMTAAVGKFPVAPFIGSNSWVVGPSKSASGKVIFANDTHIAYAQPSVWYEAHLEAPGFALYGNHLAGLPFALVGHSREHAWGLTMLENDDMDLYREKVHPDHPDSVWVRDHWEAFRVVEETIQVKGAEPEIMRLRIGPHGPLLTDAQPDISRDQTPLALWWTYLQTPREQLEALYRLGRAKDVAALKKAASMVSAAGVNVMYGNAQGDIAWLATAKLLKRADSVNSYTLLDGSTGKDDVQGFYDFSENPHSVNPPWGYVYSANNQPDTTNGVLHPGYYLPEDRAKRISQLLEAKSDWSVEDMKQMATDVVSATNPQVVQAMLAAAGNLGSGDAAQQEAAQLLANWDGNYRLESVAPTIYNRWVYFALKQAMLDELGEADFKQFLSIHLSKKTHARLLTNDQTPWWDNRQTPQQETRAELLAKAFGEAIAALKQQLGDDISQWQWYKVHTVEYVHPIGRQKPFDKLFNVGPYPALGGNEVINNLGFTLNEEGVYKSTFGPAMRIIIDFADIEHSISVLPTGQSGHVLSPHYSDQAEMYLNGGFRLQLMNWEEIRQVAPDKLELQPK